MSAHLGGCWGGVSAHLGGLDVPSDRVPLLGAMWSGAIAGGVSAHVHVVRCHGQVPCRKVPWSGAIAGCHLIGRRCHCWMQ